MSTRERGTDVTVDGPITLTGTLPETEEGSLLLSTTLTELQTAHVRLVPSVTPLSLSKSPELQVSVPPRAPTSKLWPPDLSPWHSK